MISFLIKYYSSGFREHFLKELKTNFMITYLVLWDIWLIGEDILNDSSITQTILFLLLLLPLALGAIHSFMYPNRLDKTIFLCPIKREERKHILIAGYWFRSICVLSASFIIIICLLITGFIKYSLYLPAFLVSEGMLIAMMFLENNIRITWENAYVIWRKIAEVISIVSCMFFGMAVLEYSETMAYKTRQMICLLIVLGIQTAFFLKIMISHWKKEMEHAADYEIGRR